MGPFFFFFLAPFFLLFCSLRNFKKKSYFLSSLFVLFCFSLSSAVMDLEAKTEVRVLIFNTATPDGAETWKWALNVKPLDSSQTSLIQSVRFHLHRTFNPPIVEVTEPPFRVERQKTWGTFQIKIVIHDICGNSHQFFHDLAFTQADESPHTETFYVASLPPQQALSKEEEVKLHIFNTARPNGEKKWEWALNVEPLDSSQTSLIRSVRFHLHHTFQNPIVEVTEPPFRVKRRKTWGTFQIKIVIHDICGNSHQCFHDLAFNQADKSSHVETIHVKQIRKEGIERITTKLSSLSIGTKERFKEVEPYVLDMSCREPATSTPFGQTVEGKFAIFEEIRGLGFKHVAITAFYYNQEYTIEDGFVEKLCQTPAYKDLDGCFAMYQPGDSEAWAKIQGYQIPNVFIEAALIASNIRAGDASNDRPAVIESELKRVIAWFVEKGWRQRGGGRTQSGKGNIYLNIVDLCDLNDGVTSKLQNDPLWKRLVRVVSPLNIDAFCYEEFRGIWTGDDYACVAKEIRKRFPNERILLHAHGGFNLQDAASLEAVKWGADGVWSSFVPLAAQGGHNSSLVYLSNLQRLGNQQVEETYQTNQFVTAARKIHRICQPYKENESLWAHCPIYGEYWLKIVNSAFVMGGQHQAPPAFGKLQYRIAPMISNMEVFRFRLGEVLKKKVTEKEALGVMERIRFELLSKYEADVDYNDEKELLRVYNSLSANVDRNFQRLHSLLRLGLPPSLAVYIDQLSNGRKPQPPPLFPHHLSILSEASNHFDNLVGNKKIAENILGHYLRGVSVSRLVTSSSSSSSVKLNTKMRDEAELKKNKAFFVNLEKRSQAFFQ